MEDVKVQNTFVSEIATSSSMVGKGIPFNVEVLVQNEGEVIATNQFLTLTVGEETIGQYSLQIDPGFLKVFRLR